MTKKKALRLIVDFWAFTSPVDSVLKWAGPQAYTMSAREIFDGHDTYLLGKAEKLLERDIDAFISEYYVAQDFWEKKSDLR